MESEGSSHSYSIGGPSPTTNESMGRTITTTLESEYLQLLGPGFPKRPRTERDFGAFTGLLPDRKVVRDGDGAYKGLVRVFLEVYIGIMLRNSNCQTQPNWTSSEAQVLHDELLDLRLHCLKMLFAVDPTRQIKGKFGLKPSDRRFRRSLEALKIAACRTCSNVSAVSSSKNCPERANAENAASVASFPWLRRCESGMPPFGQGKAQRGTCPVGYPYLLDVSFSL